MQATGTSVLLEEHRDLVNEAARLGMAVYPQEPQLQAADGPRIYSCMWDSGIGPGAYMRYWPVVRNDGEAGASQMTITAFFGPGCLFDKVEEAVMARDQSWPMIGSPMFGLAPGASERYKMGHRLPPVVTPGHYVLNLVLWEMNRYHQPARVHDRLHLRFELIERADPDAPSGA